MQSTSTAELMRDIYSTALSLKKTVKYNLHHVPSSSSIPTPVLFELKPSPSLQSALMSTMVRQEAVEIIRQRLCSLKDRYRRQFDVTAQKLLQSTQTPHLKPIADRLHQLRNAFQTRYENVEEPKLLDFINSMRLENVGEPIVDHQRRPPFNHESIPILEQYFKTDAYPSKHDQVALASQTNMTMKQIEVWFQNHRTRARRDGHTLQRLCRSRTPASEAKTGAEQQPPPPAVLSTPSPSPEPAPRKFIDTSSTSNRPRFPSPVWYRNPAMPLLAVPVLDIDELVAQFATKLSVKDRKLKRRSSSSPEPFEHPKQLSVQQAPLPALVRSERQLQAKPPCTQRLRSRRMARPCLASPFTPYAKLHLGNVFLPENASRLLARPPHRASATPPPIRPRPVSKPSTYPKLQTATRPLLIATAA
ncbi:homeobox-domain-containing protein [Pluteus cervinus]|uniref:Homeobox-domain-containing protein n=1 Tax=Pluteus cervinus TaxID=181527 RepID=A0ACD3BGL7_9AGAR|nr:homeobox-domain-containing protein [Pluteus cervinus]